MPYYEISESNPGGFYKFEDLFDKVLVEADDEDHAFEIFGEHFDIDIDYENAIACNCCGNRFWHPWRVDDDDDFDLNEYKNDPQWTIITTTGDDPLRDAFAVIRTAIDDKILNEDPWTMPWGTADSMLDAIKWYFGYREDS